MDMKHHIGLRVKSARRAAGLTQEQLAEALGRAVETISNIERGHALPGLESLDQIARVLNVPLTSFLEGYDRTRKVNRARLELEQTVSALCHGFSDKELELAIRVLSALTPRL